MPYSVELTGTTHTLPTRKEIAWTTAVNNFYTDIVSLLSGTFQEVTASGATTNVSLADGHNITLNLDASTTVTLTDDRDGDRYYFTIIQGGDNTLAWADTIKWREGSAPVITTGAGAVDAICLMKHPTVGYMGEFAQGFA